MDKDNLLKLLLSQRAMLIGYVSAIVRDSSLAEDIFQNVAVLVLKKADSLEEGPSLAGWFRKAARFEALKALKKRDRIPPVLDETVLDLLEEEWAASDETADESADLEALRRCMERLTPNSRRLLKLRYHEGLVGAPLGERLAKPLNTIYVALARIHRKLAECVKAAARRQEAAHA